MINKNAPDGDVRIRSTDAVALTPWTLPEVSGDHLVALETKSHPKKKPSLPEADLRDVGLALQREKPPKDIVTVSEAESIREAAHQDGLLQGLVEGREQGYPEGLEKGLVEGKERGYQDALTQGQAEINQAVANLAEMLQALHQPLAQQEQALESLVAGLVVKLSRAVIDVELNTRPEIIQNAIRDALQQLPQGGGALTIEVSPADLPHVEPIAGRLSFPVSVAADGSISPGSFRLHTSDSLIESDIQQQFQMLSEQLFASLTQQNPEA
ncbi:MAG: hypothetical protein KC477_01950 [Oceanospirillaceae bacterium]|nr:hypothetical protein [Oceanospirillaceae bacterium]